MIKINKILFPILIIFICNFTQFSLSYTQTEIKDAQIAFEELEQGSSPELIESTFSYFVLTHFGAERDDLIYEKFGSELELNEEGFWSYESLNSIAISFETTLPAKSYIEYGTTTSYGEQTDEQINYNYIHLKHIKNLNPDTTYYYRIVLTDERGNIVNSQDRTFSTKTASNTIKIPGTLNGPPYILDSSNSLYILESDITVDLTAFDIKANGITLDLGGNTVTYANSIMSEVAKINEINTAGVGIYSKESGGLDNIKIVNGIIKEGPHQNRPYVNSWGGYDGGLNPIYLSDVDNVEVAGIIGNYHAANVHGFYFNEPDEVYNIHHNIFFDRGWEVINRHGSSGGRSINFNSAPEEVNEFEVHHNLVKRTKQNGFSKAQESYNNEIYVDSWSTNSFAQGANSLPDKYGGKIINNKIFLTGYHAIGISWAHLDLNVTNNLIHMESVDTKDWRWYEEFGDRNSLNGLRITNYDSGGQVRDNLQYNNNLIIGNCRDDVEMRGTELYSDYSITNTQVQNSIIKVEVDDDETTKAAAVVTHGTSNLDHGPTYYRNNRLISNICNVRFGDYYGRGYNHQFINCTFEKTGDNTNYQTFIFDGAYSRDGHAIIDPIFLNGASYDDVYWKQTGDLSSYKLMWTTIIIAEPDSTIIIKNVDDEIEFVGTINSQGILSIPLTQVEIRPTEWTQTSTGSEVHDKLNHQKVFKTPHTITVQKNNKINTTIITVDSKQTVNIGSGEIIINDEINIISIIKSINEWKQSLLTKSELIIKLDKYKQGIQ